MERGREGAVDSGAAIGESGRRFEEEGAEGASNLGFGREYRESEFGGIGACFLLFLSYYSSNWSVTLTSDQLWKWKTPTL